MKVRYRMVMKMAIFLLLSISTQAFSQIRLEPAPPPKKVTSEEELARQQTRWMNKNLDLNLEQYMKVNTINLTYAHNVDSVDKLAGKINKSDIKVKMKDGKEAELKAILTPEQYRQFQQRKEKQVVQKKSPFSNPY